MMRLELSSDVVADDSGVDSPGSSLGSPIRPRTAMSHEEVSSAPTSPGSPGSSSPPEMKVQTERQLISRGKADRKNTVRNMIANQQYRYPYPNQGSPQIYRQASPPSLPAVINDYTSAWPTMLTVPSSTGAVPSTASAWPPVTSSTQIVVTSPSIGSSYLSSGISSAGPVTSQPPQVAVVHPVQSPTTATINDEGAVNLIIEIGDTYSPESPKVDIKPDINNQSQIKRYQDNSGLDIDEVFKSVDSGYTSILSEGGNNIEDRHLQYDMAMQYDIQLPGAGQYANWSPPQAPQTKVTPPNSICGAPIPTTTTLISKNGMSIGTVHEVTNTNSRQTSTPLFPPLYVPGAVPQLESLPNLYGKDPIMAVRPPKGPPTTTYIPPCQVPQQRSVLRPSQLDVNNKPPQMQPGYSNPQNLPVNMPSYPNGQVHQSYPTSYQPTQPNLCLARQISHELSKNELLRQDDDGDTYLTIVVMQGNCDVVQAVAEQMVTLNLSLDIPEKSGKTALMLAVMEERWDMVVRLVRLGADVNKQDKEGRTVLHFIAEKGSIDVLKAIKETHKDINMDCKNYQGLTALHCALMESGHCQGQLKQLPRAQSVINVPGTVMETREKQVLRTKQQKLQQVVKMVLDMGASPSCQDGKSGRTALHHAVQSCSPELVELLLLDYKDANNRHKFVNQTTYNGNTALHSAVGLQDDNRADIVKLLVKSGADQSIRNDENDRAIDLVKKEDTAVRSTLGGGRKFRN